MNKRFVTVLLCFILLLGISVPAYAEQVEAQEPSVNRELTISTAEEFVEFAESCRLDNFSKDLLVSLENDVDLTGTDFSGVPTFSGEFQGNGHTISGVSITNDGSYQGLFRYITAEASVKDLTVEGEIQPGGSRSTVGGIAGNNAGSILNCTFIGTVSGGDYVGGIAGKNTVTGVLEWCSVEGSIYGDHFVGGIAGENTGVIRKSSNNALINHTPQQNAVSFADITLDSLTNSESANTVTDIGGIAGISSGVIRECKNRGAVGYKLMGYNIGGIAGTQSGYIVDCENFAPIQGRKEVGGIVGQMEPVSMIEFTEDTIQILQGQLSTMTGLVSSASANAQTSGSQIANQIGVLKGQVQTAKDAAESLLPSSESPYLPDVDTILAAQNTLSSTVQAMPQTMRGLTSGVESMLSGLNRDLNAISGQLSVMGQTLNNASENLGGTINDISDQDTPELLTGKIENCVNQGSVLGDLNAGGIAGAMAVENDLDIQEDWEQNGEASLNFQSDVRAVILNCENSGVVTGKKQNVGGITGWQSLGLVKSCTNTGKIDGSAADHVGGVSGQSSGFIRASFAKCEILGSTYVGGIAGSASVVTDSMTQVKLTGCSEKIGAILGWAEENRTEVENPISGNYYLLAEQDYGAVDGISYTGIAEPKNQYSFLAVDGLPDVFKKATLRFVFADGTATEVSVPVGSRLLRSKVPEIPEVDGCNGVWEGLDEIDFSDIQFDMTFEAVYSSQYMTLESAQCREDGRPVLLVEGSFAEDALVTVSKSEAAPELTDKEILLEVWNVQTAESGHTARFLLPENADSENLKLLVCDGDTWTDTQFYINGSYLVFTLDEAEAQIALVQMQENNTVWLLVAAGALVVVLLVVVFIIRKKRSSKVSETVEKSA